MKEPQRQPEPQVEAKTSRPVNNHFIKRQTIICRSPWTPFCYWSDLELASAPCYKSEAHCWLGTLNWLICKHANEQ